LDREDALRKLAELRDQGSLDDEEFAEEEARILDMTSEDAASEVDGDRPNQTRKPEDAPSGEDRVTPRPDESLPEAPSHHPTWDELVYEPEIGTVLKSNIVYYKVKFQEIVVRHKIGGLAISDKKANDDVEGAKSWNWAGFFLGAVWGAYRGVSLWRLILLFTILIILWLLVPGWRWLGLAVVLPSLVFGLYGNSALLKDLARQATISADFDVPFRKPSPSWSRGLFAAACVVLSAVLTFFIVFFPGKVLALLAPFISEPQSAVPSQSTMQIILTTQCNATIYDDGDRNEFVVAANTPIVVLRHGRIVTLQQHQFYRVLGPHDEYAWIQTGAFVGHCPLLVDPTLAVPRR